MRWVFVVDKRSKVFCIWVVVKGIGGTTLEVWCEGERCDKIVGFLKGKEFPSLYVCCEGQKILKKIELI